MRRHRPLLPRLVIALTAIGLFLVSYQWGSQYRYGANRPPALSGVLVRPPRPLPDLVLADGSDRPFGSADLLDHWGLLVFAPGDGAQGERGIARLIDVYNRLADRPGLQRRLRLLLVGADAAPRLARDFRRLAPVVAVLTADTAELETLRAALGAGPGPTAGPTEDGLQTLFLIDPKLRLLALFPASQPAAEVAADVAALAAWPGSGADTVDD